MIKDSCDFSRSNSEQFDVCIIGAGAAGITIARRLQDSGMRIALLEGGGLDFSETSQRIYEGVSVGHADLSTARLRYFGGTTNHWAGYCRAPQEIDFSERNWIPGSGWAMPHRDIEAYLTQAAEIVDVEPSFAVASWAGKFRTRPLTFETPGLEQRVSVVSPPIRFGDTFRETIQSSKNIRF